MSGAKAPVRLQLVYVYCSTQRNWQLTQLLTYLLQVCVAK